MDLIPVKDAALSYLDLAKIDILKLFRTSLKVDLKADQSPVTMADKKTGDNSKIGTATMDSASLANCRIIS